MSISYKDLTIIAEQDFRTVQTMEGFFPDEFAIRTACYHLEQAVEKGLKALILLCGESPKFTHDIDSLIEHCEQLGETFSDNAKNVADTLTVWEAKNRCDPAIKLNPAKYQLAKGFFQEIRFKIAQNEELIQRDDPQNSMSQDISNDENEEMVLQ